MKRKHSELLTQHMREAVAQHEAKIADLEEQLRSARVQLAQTRESYTRLIDNVQQAEAWSEDIQSPGDDERADIQAVVGKGMSEGSVATPKGGWRLAGLTGEGQGQGKGEDKGQGKGKQQGKDSWHPKGGWRPRQGSGQGQAQTQGKGKGKGNGQGKAIPARACGRRGPLPDTRS